MKRLFIAIILAIAGAAGVQADPLFPYFVDLTGANEYIPHTTFLRDYPTRKCDYYAPVSSYYQKNASGLFSFLNDVLPSNVLASKRELKDEKYTAYIYQDDMLDNVKSFLIVIVYIDDTIGVEYIEAKTQ